MVVHPAAPFPFASRLVILVWMGLVWMGLAPLSAASQEVVDIIRGVSASYAEAYVQPLANALGAGMNAGLFHGTGAVGAVPGVDVYIGVKAMGVSMANQDRTLDLVYETSQSLRAVDGNTYTVPTTFRIDEGPTFFGDKSPGTVMANVHETVHPGLDGLDGTVDDVVLDTTVTFDLLPGAVTGPAMPAVPQVGFGSIAGTDVLFRYLPSIRIREVGKIDLFGAGIRHSVSQYLPFLPLDIAGQFVVQRISLQGNRESDAFTASSWAANLVAGKTFAVLTVYGGVQIESASFQITYTLVPDHPDIDPQMISLDLLADSTFRVTAGTSLNLGLILVNLDASSIGQRTVLSGGVGFAL